MCVEIFAILIAFLYLHNNNKNGKYFFGFNFTGWQHWLAVSV